MYFKEIPDTQKTYHGISAAGNFIAAAVQEDDGTWSVYSGPEEKPVLEGKGYKSLEDAFDFMQTMTT